MIMSGVRIDAAARLILERQLHLLRTRNRDRIAREECAVVGDHDRQCVAIGKAVRQTECARQRLLVERAAFQVFAPQAKCRGKQPGLAAQRIRARNARLPLPFGMQAVTELFPIIIRTARLIIILGKPMYRELIV